MKHTKEELTTRYLLGELPGPEQDDFEKKYLADDAAYEELLVAEDQLIDAFVRNELSADEREQFERHFMVSPIRRERVEFARALMNPEIDPLLMPSEAQPKASAQSSFGWTQRLAWMGAPLIVVLIVVSSWFFFENRRLSRELVRVRSEKPVLVKEEQRSAMAPLDKRVASLVLVPGLSRDSASVIPAPPRVRLAQDIGSLSVQLELEEAPGNITYRAAVETAEGRQIWNRSGLPKRQRNRGSGFVLIEIPTAVLRPGDYIVMLRADGTLTEIGDYHFRVLR